MALAIGAFFTFLAAITGKILEFLATGGSYRSKIAKPATNLNIVFQITKEIGELGKNNDFLTENEKNLIHEIIESSLANIHYGEYLTGRYRENFAALYGNMPSLIAKIHASRPRCTEIIILFIAAITMMALFSLLSAWLINKTIFLYATYRMITPEVALQITLIAAIVIAFMYSINFATAALMAPFYLKKAKRLLANH